MRLPFSFSVNIIVAISSLVLALTLVACTSGSHLEKPPATINFDKDWQFFRAETILTLADAKSYSAWESIQIPHTPKIEPYIVNDQFQGDAWYKKSFSANSTWKNKRVVITFEAAMNHAQIWLNGQKLAEHLGGYLPFSIDLTDHLKWSGNNEIMLRLDNRDNPITGPKPLNDLDFNTYGGIYRHVYLSIKPNIHITDAVAINKPASGGIFVTFPVVSQQYAKVSVKTHVANTSDKNRKLRVEHILQTNQKTIASNQSNTTEISAGDETSIALMLDVDEPKLWSPKAPNLYQLITRVYVDEQLTETKKTPIGIREFKFVNNQLFINGEKTFLRGVNRHQEYPYIGYATSDAVDYRDALKIKAAGFDYVRLSHYPHSPAFMKAADEIGLVLLNSILGWQYFSEDAAFKAQVQQTCRDLIRRDRNHPSVLAWECSLNESAMTEAFVDSLTAIVQEEYPGAYSAGWQDYGYDIYLQARQHRLEHYTYPTKPYIVSEYGDWEYYAGNGGLNQSAWADLKQTDRSSRQLLSDGEKRLQQQAKNLQEAHNDNFRTPAFADGYWVMFDYNRGYAPDLEASGVMSLDRLPKFSYYFFQSQRDASERSDAFDSGPMVFIASYWQEDSSVKFPVFSNAEEVALYLNGEKIAQQKPDSDNLSNLLAHPPFTFNLKKFTPGELKAVAYIDGKAVAEHIVKTPGEAVRISFFADASGITPKEGVKDTVFLYARLVDAKGTTVPTSGREITFSLKGDAKLISPNVITTQAGVAAALIEVGDNLADVRITARSEGVKGITLGVAKYKMW